MQLDYAVGIFLLSKITFIVTTQLRSGILSGITVGRSSSHMMSYAAACEMTSRRSSSSHYLCGAQRQQLQFIIGSTHGN
jgi:hypothetical protein